ncbi:MAG: hypothetical protein M1833_003253 [Piccolia ochrophora]|nr:MAG: hypothetical protein M1833_003253 [Piccolia ochrophora]
MIFRGRLQAFALHSRRGYATQQKPVSPHIGFYQSFGRPIAKVFLGAVFTYQCAYWLWVKLETVEVRGKKEAEIKALESRLRELPQRKNDRDVKRFNLDEGR